MADNARVVEVDTAQTHPLRISVLRNGTPDRNPGYDADDDPTTRHLAVTVDERVVAVSTWIVAPFPRQPDARGVQIRGMATEPAWRGRGYGARLLEVGRAEAAAQGIDVVWARARSTALGFYLANGFVAVGDDFVDEASALPHRLVRCPH